MRLPNALATLLIPHDHGRYGFVRGMIAAVGRLDIATGFSSGSIEGTIIIAK